MGKSLFRRAFSLKNGLRALALATVLAAALVVAKGYWDRQIFLGYDASLPLDPEIVAEEKKDAFRMQKITITGLAGERIPLRLMLPDGPEASRFPCVVFLYGIGQDMRFFDEIAPIFAAHGVALAMPEQFSRGERRGPKGGVWQKTADIRERASRLVPETRRVVDYLSGRADIDPGQISLIGASYGGILGCAVLAREPRLRSGALVMAGGDFPTLFSAMVKRQRPDSRVVWPALGGTAAWIFGPFDPLHFVGHISPRPLLFLNVEDDEMIDHASADALFREAGNPKKEIWYGGAHNAISEETVRRMLDDALGWMRAQRVPAAAREIEP